MWSAAIVLRCALDLLSGRQNSLPPIEFVSVPPAGVSPTAEAFVLPGLARIHIVTSSDAFRFAQQGAFRCAQTDILNKLASVIVHEDWHVRHGPDEGAAYAAQLTALAEMRAGLDSPIYQGVLRAMNKVTGPKARR